MRNYDKHVRLVDYDGSGIKREIAVLKEFKDGTVSYIQLDLLDRFDLSRMRQAIEGPHGAQYELYEILSNINLSNGMNALDYFHQIAKIKPGDGTVTPQVAPRRSVRNARKDDARTKVIGSEFSDPTSATKVNSTTM